MKAKSYMDQGQLVPDDVTIGDAGSRPYCSRMTARTDMCWMDFPTNDSAGREP